MNEQLPPSLGYKLWGAKVLNSDFDGDTMSITIEYQPVQQLQYFEVSLNIDSYSSKYDHAMSVVEESVP